MPGGPPIVPMRLQPLPEFKPFEQPVIAHDKVRYVGEPIAVVLADSPSPSARTRWKRSRSRSRNCPPSPTGRPPRPNKSILFDKPGTNRSLTFESRKGDADAAFANAPYTRREQLRTGRHYGLTMEPRGVMATWDDASAKLTIYGAAKVPFFNRRILSAQIGLPIEQIEMIENDVGGGYGARGEFYPEDFLIPFAARHVKPPGEVDRGPPRKSDGDEPRPRGGVRPRGRLRARRHHPGDPRRGPHRHGRLHAHQRRGRRPQRLRSSWPGRTACRTSRSTRISG